MGDLEPGMGVSNIYQRIPGGGREKVKNNR